jgi:hypothetical protein
MGGRAPPRKSRRPLEQIIGTTQLAVLLLQLTDPLRLDAGQARLDTLVDVSLLDPRPKRLHTAADLIRDPLDRPVRRTELLA